MNDVWPQVLSFTCSGRWREREDTVLGVAVDLGKMIKRKDAKDKRSKGMKKEDKTGKIDYQNGCKQQAEGRAENTVLLTQSDMAYFMHFAVWPPKSSLTPNSEKLYDVTVECG
jgi:hypothetical protein